MCSPTLRQLFLFENKILHPLISSSVLQATLLQEGGHVKKKTKQKKTLLPDKSTGPNVQTCLKASLFNGLERVNLGLAPTCELEEDCCDIVLVLFVSSDYKSQP